MEEKLSDADLKIMEYVTSQQKQNKLLRRLAIINLLILLGMIIYGLYEYSKKPPASEVTLKHIEQREQDISSREKLHQEKIRQEDARIAHQDSMLIVRNVLITAREIAQVKQDSLNQLERQEMIFMKKQLLQTESFQRNKPKK